MKAGLDYDRTGTMKKYRKWSDIEKEHFTPEQIAENRKWAENETVKINLRAIRDLLGMSPAQFAKKTKKLEAQAKTPDGRAGVRVENVRRYVEALGGELEIVARFGDKAVRLYGV